MTNATLTERSFITPQSANGVVKIMEAKGWVGRIGHPTHGRLIQLYLTKEGKTVLRKCDAAIDNLEATMLTRLRELPNDTLQRIFQRCISNLRL